MEPFVFPNGCGEEEWQIVQYSTLATVLMYFIKI
ncbi:hypothetical protein T05_2358 [Trichinella murrelli]|uniref:Uncharacterized protein n=1 Tax=Trichinella murrelli TaxID=144512 RepID=A0A0V0SUZ6_9BILA|nr:hypothetical protein T05_2358 [Trichinella murrelli]